MSPMTRPSRQSGRLMEISRQRYSIRLKYSAISTPNTAYGTSILNALRFMFRNISEGLNTIPPAMKNSGTWNVYSQHSTFSCR